MDEQLVKELRAVQETLTVLQQRVRELERRIAGSPTPTAHALPPTPAKREPPRPVRPTATVGTGAAETLETKIGRYWLNRVGIISLVLGVAFFILYSFQYLGPAAKIAIGFAVGLTLLGTGVWLERRAGFGWYARGLLGGGWAVVYFTTYAMHHIPAVRILHSAVGDLLLLVAVVAGAIWHALTYRSQVITALAFTLGFLTTSISDVTYFTLASSVLLVVSLAMVAVRMRWHSLYLYGVVGSYLTHLVWISRQIAISPMVAIHVSSAAAAQFWLQTGCLSLYWVAYTTAALCLDEQGKKERDRLLTATLVNGALFTTQWLRAMELVFPTLQYLALLGIGAAYAALGPVAERRRLPTISTAHWLLGLTLMTLAIPEYFTGRWTSFLWTVEVAALTWLGLRYNRWAYRVFAFGLGIMVFFRLIGLDLASSVTIAVGSWAVPWRLLMGVVGVASFAASAACYRHQRYLAHRRPIEQQAFHLYAAAASIVAWMLTAVEANRQFIPLYWAIEASVVILLGWRLKDRALRMFGLVWFVPVTVMVVSAGWFEQSWWHAWVTAGVTGLLYAAGLLYRTQPAGDRFDLERFLHEGYTGIASAVLAMLLWIEVPRHWLSLAWASQGFGLVATGFLLRDRAFRISGLSVFGLLVLKILLVDLAGAETIYRILSFIVVGALLLVASLAYARFAGRPTPKE